MLQCREPCLLLDVARQVVAGDQPTRERAQPIGMGEQGLDRSGSAGFGHRQP
jgi:hypothetical protein